MLEAVSKAVDEFEACCKMRGPADGTASEEAVRDGGEAKKDCRHGVDGIEIGCMIVGSLGHFGANGEAVRRDEALRPIPKIFDSVRR